MSVYKNVFLLSKRIDDLERELLALTDYVVGVLRDVVTHEDEPAPKKKAKPKKKKEE
jgi:hypothetical protein